jgi:hypothetical protein
MKGMGNNTISYIILIGLFLAIGGAGFFCGYTYRATHSVPDIIIVSNASIESPPYSIIESCGMSYELIKLDTIILSVNDMLPHNGTNCYPRAILLQKYLKDAGYNATIKLGQNLDKRLGHAWVEINGLEIWGTRAEFPTEINTQYKVTELEVR